jgi:hypothetical protein
MATAKVDQPEETPDAPRITFVGFSASGTTGTVYVDMTRPVSPTQSASEGRVTFSLPGTIIHGKNNQRALDTKYFGTPVDRVRLVPGAEGATLELTVHGKPVVSHRVIRGESAARLSIRVSPPANDQP